MSLPDWWRLAVGTLTAFPVAAPTRVDRSVARNALLLAPLAAVPLGIGVALLGQLGLVAELPASVVALLAVALMALGTRALHWDGLADVADGLTSSYDADRALQVMKSGTVGPAGVVAILLVGGLQAAGLASLFTTTRGCVVAGVAVMLSRWSLLVPCLRGVPAARPDGLGASFAGSVPRFMAVLAWVVAASLLWVVSGDLYGPLAWLVAVIVASLLTLRAVRRFRGVTGDVLGASVETSLAAVVVVLA